MQNQRAAQTINSALDFIACGEQIPALPAGVPRLLQKLSDDDIELLEISDAISEFPSIASRLLFLANSAWSAPTVPIDNLQFACSKLGLSVIRSVSIALSIATPFNPLLCKPFDTYKYWLNALMVGDVAKLLATESESISSTQTSALQTAGILHNIGLLWLADRLPAQTGLALQDYTADRTISLERHLLNHCHYGYCSVNGKLATAWNFPPLLHNIMCHHNTLDFDGDFHLQCHAVGLATEICEYVLNDEPGEAPFGDSRTTMLHLSDESLTKVVDLCASRRKRFESLISAFLQG